MIETQLQFVLYVFFVFFIVLPYCAIWSYEHKVE